MPALVAPLLGFALGVLFAWTAADEAARRGATGTGRALWATAAFGLLVYAPVAGYFLTFWPDWSFAYVLDSERLPAGVDLVLILANVACCPAGFLAGQRSAGERRLAPLLRIAAGGILPATALLLVTFRRLAVNASYAQFHGDFGIRPTAGSALGYALLWMAAVLVFGVLWTLRGLRRISAAAGRD